MMHDSEEDFFFEEDKIAKQNASTPLLVDFGESSERPTIDDPLLEEQTQEAQVLEENALGANALPTINADLDAVVCAGPDNSQDLKYNDYYKQQFELERLGMTVSTSSVVIAKDESNLIGISIGGGSPMCPCLYIVQVFDGTPAALEGSLESGDELLAINNVSVKGKTKVEVAKMIQAAQDQVTIHYNKLHANTEQGKSIDIMLKKLKHRIVDSMSANTADTLGLSRAILCNDSLVKRLEELEGTEHMYKGIVEHSRRMLKAYYDVLQSYKDFGDVFVQIGAHETQQRASEVFRTFGEFHRALERDGLQIIKDIKPVVNDLGTYLNKAIPDTKATVQRYADAKFTYLSYCLKVKEMDDEEQQFAALQESLYRVETGNYEYRLILRCRQDARAKFARLRTDVLEKMELLECKHAQDLNKQMHALISCLGKLSKMTQDRLEALPTLFPIEVDFKDTDFQYKSSTLKPQYEDEDDDDDDAEGATDSEKPTTSKAAALARREIDCGLEAVEQPANVISVKTKSNVDEPSEANLIDIPSISDTEGATALPDDSNETLLLKELGLFGIDLSSNPQTINNQKDAMKDQKNDFDFDLFLNQATATTTQLEQDLMLANALETDLLLQ